MPALPYKQHDMLSQTTTDNIKIANDIYHIFDDWTI